MSRLVLFTSDNGVLLLAGADQRLGLMGTMAPVIRDHRIPARITHTTSEILRARIFAMHVAELPGCGRSGRSTEGPGLQLNIPWRHEIQTDDRLEPDVLETHPGCTGGTRRLPTLRIVE